MAFIKDLKYGKDGEEAVVKILQKNKIKAEINTDKKTRLYYDIIAELNKKKFYIEVKYDLYAIKSGNIAIEYYNTSKDEASGIDITEASLWAHLVPTKEKELEIWLTSVNALQDYISKNKPYKNMKNVGDGNAHIYLYKKDIICEDIFYNIKLLDEKTLKQTINFLLKVQNFTE